MIVFHLLNVNNGNMVKAVSLLFSFLIIKSELKPFQVKKVNERIDFIKFIKELEPKSIKRNYSW